MFYDDPQPCHLLSFVVICCHLLSFSPFHLFTFSPFHTPITSVCSTQKTQAAQGILTTFHEQFVKHNRAIRSTKIQSHALRVDGIIPKYAPNSPKHPSLPLSSSTFNVYSSLSHVCGLQIEHLNPLFSNWKHQNSVYALIIVLINDIIMLKNGRSLFGRPWHSTNLLMNICPSHRRWSSFKLGFHSIDISKLHNKIPRFVSSSIKSLHHDTPSRIISSGALKRHLSQMISLGDRILNRCSNPSIHKNTRKSIKSSRN